VADVTNASLPEIVALNPSLLRMTTPVDLSFDLHLPVGTKDVFNERLKEIPESKRNAWRFHVVRPGESLDGIATSLHAHANEVAEVNGLKAGEGVEEGDELVVPVAAASSNAHPQRYTVRRGETLVAVADRFNVSVEDLRGWNRLSANTVRAGQTLNVAEPVRLAPSMRSRRAAVRGRGAKRTVSGKASRGAAARASSRPSHAASHGAAAKTTVSRSSKSGAHGAASAHASPSKTKHKAAR
jgi:membrane-bound lytic murein transglycosylase D